MEIRQTRLDEVETLQALYDRGRQFMRENGNAHQWPAGYPNEEVITSDITSGKSYVCVDEGEIIGAFYFAQEVDPTYGRIEEGQWLNDEPYGVLHRVVVGKHHKGVGAFCIQWCKEQCDNLRIDTHKDNIAMQLTVKRTGFVHCGIIYLANGEPRWAYHWVK